MKPGLLLVLAALLFMGKTNCIYANLPYAATSVIYVDSSKASGGNGLSPTTAFKYLQNALDYASTLNNTLEIHVAKGTYYPDDGNSVTNGDREASFRMLNNVQILGGYPSGFQASKGRNWNTRQTILSGDINQDGTLLTHQIIKNDYDKNTPLTSTAILNGFIIELSDGWPSNGGGLYNFFSSAKIQNCIFRNNEARFGGAIENVAGSPVFENCIFFDNKASFGGNVFKNTSTSLTLINCTIANNTAAGQSNIESITNEDSEIVIRNSILWNNGTELADVAAGQSNTYDIKYTDISGGYTGTGNLNIDPLFKDEAANDYSLKVLTPVYNKGNNGYNSLALDFAGNNRFLYNTVDMGAYEYVTGRIYIKKTASGANNGSSWTDAFQYFREANAALAAASTPADVWVAADTYHPYELSHDVGSDFRTRAFQLLNNVRFYGGFNGTETLLGQRNWEVNQTILSGDLEDNDHTGDYNANSFHVFYNQYTELNPLTATARLDGFIIKGGNANASGLNTLGGAMLNQYAAPTIANCTFKDNRALNGGAIYNANSSPVISDSYFQNNIASIQGGAIVYTESTVTLIRCNFSDNSCTNTNSNASNRTAGAIAISYSNGSVNDCVFEDNYADIAGGAIKSSGGSVMHFNDCIFNANESERGGALLIETGGSTLPNVGETYFNNCQFAENYSEFSEMIREPDHYGGAIYVVTGSVFIDGCTFDANITENYGGAIYFYHGASTVKNSTFINNLAFYLDGDPQLITPAGGAIGINDLAHVTIENCLFKDNTSRDFGGAIFTESNDTEIINCLFIDNEASIGQGGDINVINASCFIRNCTFVNILLQHHSAIANTGGARSNIYNSIIWGRYDVSPIFNFGDGEANADKCIIKGGYIFGTNILNEDPKFLDSLNADFTLQRCSPGIDFGSISYNSTAEDLAGNPRVYDPSVQGYILKIDLGAYEAPYSFQTNCNCPANLNLHGNTSSSVLRSAETINSGSVILSGENVTLGANNHILLVPPFETQSTAVFKTELNGCVN